MNNDRFYQARLNRRRWRITIVLVLNEDVTLVVDEVVVDEVVLVSI